jgi:hypothetical protein
VGKEGELCGAPRWTMAYLRLDRDNNFDADWIKEMDLVSDGLADLKYCKKKGMEVPIMAYYLLDHGVKLNHHGQFSRREERPPRVSYRPAFCV